MNTADIRAEIQTFMARNPGWAGMGTSMLRILDAGERDRRKIAALAAERDAALALAERRAGETAKLIAAARRVTDAWWRHGGDVEREDAIYRLTQYLDELAAAGH